MTTFLCQRLWKNSYNKVYLQDSEYVFLSLFEQYDTFPELYGTCGELYVVEELRPLDIPHLLGKIFLSYFALFSSFFFFLLLFHSLFFSLLAFVSLLKCFFYTVLFLPFSLLKLLKLGYFPFFSLFFFKFF